MLDRDVALKVMLPQIAADPDQKARFEREARAVARIVHPNVITVFDLGYHHDGSPFIAMELLKGTDLFQRMRQDEPLTFEQKVDVVVQMLEGLAHGHQAGIVHRDVKPANLFLTTDGTVKIMDFGVARFTMTSVTEAGAVLGTADYMAPEYVQGAGVDRRCDLWSAGCVLHELFSGHRPFAGESVMTVFYKITHQDPPELPADARLDALRPIVRRALAREPDQRYQAAAEFAADLKPLLRGWSRPAPAAAAPEAVPAPAVERPATLDLLKQLEDEAKGSPWQDPTPLFRLMREVYVGAKSGHLHFTHGTQRRSLFFLRGLISHATSDVEGEHLGNTLVRYGLIGQAELERVTPIVLGERKRLGTVLQEQAILDRARLEEGVGLHVRDLLFDVLGREGAFAFEEMWSESEQGERPGLATPGQIILEAARRLQAPEIVEKVLGDVDRALALSNNPLLRVQRLTLSPTDGFLLSRIDGALTAREVFQIIPLPQDDVARSLFCLLCTGLVEYVPRTATSRAKAALDAERNATAPRADDFLPPPPPAPPARPSTGATQAAGPSVPPPLAVDTGERRRQEILDAFDGMATRNYFETLGVSAEATETDVREAYARLARKFHPDAGGSDPALADLRAEREAVFVRLGVARDALLNPATRERHMRMAGIRPQPRPSSPSGSGPSSSPGSGPSSSLGSAPAPSPPPREPEMDSPFAETPFEKAERERDEAIRALPQAARLLREDKVWDAIQLLEPALPRLGGALRHKARVLLARAYMKNPRWLKRAEESAQQALREGPESGEAYAVLGAIYRAAGQPTRATTAFRRALELDPRNMEAHVGLFGKPPDDAPATGIRRLFGRR
jgi:tetratricopeptide (TPR) repeat protein